MQVLKSKWHKDFNGIQLWKLMSLGPVSLIEHKLIDTKKIIIWSFNFSTRTSARRLKNNKESKRAFKAKKIQLES
jgi:hypothetical protein